MALKIIHSILTEIFFKLNFGQRSLVLAMGHVTSVM